MKDKWTALKALRHARHDWMNDIQLIKGYLALEKADEAARTIDHMVLKAVHESKLCNLSMPGMAELFITFNWEQHLFVLEYEVDDNITTKKADDNQAVRFFTRLFSMFEEHVQEFRGQSLYIRLFEKEKQLFAQLEWSGDQSSPDHLVQSLERFQETEFQVFKWEISDEDVLMEVKL